METSSLGSSTPSVVQQRLKYIVERCQGWWIYAIFWQAYKDNDHQIHLSFGDSYFQGLKDFHQPPFTNIHQTISSSIHPCSKLIVASIPRSFVLGEDIIGGTFGSGSTLWLAGHNNLGINGSQRAEEVYLHGIKTLACVPTCWGVVEFGSLDVLKEDLGLASLTMSLFSSENDPTTKGNHPNQFQQLTHDQDHSLLLDLGSPSTSTRENTPTKKSRKGKNAITDPINPKYKDTERDRREKLNQRFYALRSVVPYVSKMDKASLLADAVTYIGELKSKIQTLTKKAETMQLNLDDNGAPVNYMIHESTKVEVKIVGSDAVIRVQSPDVNHPAARLMDAMKELDFSVRNASVSNISDMMIQDVVAQIPEGFPNDEGILSATILENL